jgi:Tol biopolymer transport system component
MRRPNKSGTETMKTRLFVLLLVAAVVTLTSGSGLQADSTEIWNTGNITTISHNSFPQIKGNCLVWQGCGGLEGATSGSADCEIFLYDIDNQVVTQVTDDDYDDISPQTDGDYVVWQKHDTSRGNQIFLYAIDGTDPPGGTMISNDDDKDNYSPRIAAGRVVWTSQLVARSFEPGEIMLYDAKTRSGPDSISDSTSDCSSPRINSETVVWVQSNTDGTTTLFIYDLTSENPEPEPAPEDFVWPDGPQTDGNLMVLTRHDGNDREIFIYNSDSGRYHQVTDNDLEDTYPSISENRVGWMGGEEIFVAEYEYLGLRRPADNAVLSNDPPATFSWEAIGYDKFKVKFSAGPEFPTSGLLAFPPSEGSWLSETSFTPSEESWGTIRTMARTYGVVYWRVEGMNTEGSLSYSETWSFTIYDGVTATTTTGGGGDSGPCFIGTVAFD